LCSGQTLALYLEDGNPWLRMNHSSILIQVFLFQLAGVSCLWAQSSPLPGVALPAPASTAAPFSRGEVLNYSVNWPSGLSLGEAQLRVGSAEPGWDFEFTLNASLPGFEVKDHYRSEAGANFCSSRLEKDFVHGTRKTKETVSYDQQKHQAERKTDAGGKSEVAISDCVKDGMTFLYYLRRELASGRLPPAQVINFGAPYEISVAYGDARDVETDGVKQKADRILVSLRGPASSHSFEILFARDKARTPLEVRVPFSLGTFALELAR